MFTTRCVDLLSSAPALCKSPEISVVTEAAAHHISIQMKNAFIQLITWLTCWASQANGWLVVQRANSYLESKSVALTLS